MGGADAGPTTDGCGTASFELRDGSTLLIPGAHLCTGAAHNVVATRKVKATIKDGVGMVPLHGDPIPFDAGYFTTHVAVPGDVLIEFPAVPDGAVGLPENRAVSRILAVSRPQTIATRNSICSI